MKYEVYVTRHAESDLADAFAYLVAEAPQEAQGWLSNLRRKLTSLQRFPRRCRKAYEARAEENLRQLVVGRFRVLFLLEGKRVYVLTVQRNARLPIGRRELHRRLGEGREIANRRRTSRLSQ